MNCCHGCWLQGDCALPCFTDNFYTVFRLGVPTGLMSVHIIVAVLMFPWWFLWLTAGWTQIQLSRDRCRVSLVTPWPAI